MKRNTLLIVICACVVLTAVVVCIALIVVFHGIPRSGEQQQGIWDNIRLPTSLIPSRYDVYIRSDFVNFTFGGSVSIDVRCDEETDVVVLHCMELDISDISVTPLNTSQPIWESNLPVEGNPWFHKENQYLVFKLKRSLLKGTWYTIHVNFSGPLDQDSVGYFKTSYETSSGTRWMGSTHMAIVHARKAFPCFDEPAFKARFLFTLDHTPEYQAISNMPISSTSTVEDGWIRSKFTESIPMSTYLVGWSVFDLSSKEKFTTEGVLFRVWARTDVIDTVDYALERGADMLSFYGQYFGTSFPLQKIDSVAVPSWAGIAMENWGMNVYQPSKLLYEEGVTTSYDQLRTCAVIAHELAHQWFGNLVTLNWWDDLWLNEGFASYLEYLGTNHTEPDWNMMDMFLWRDKFPVFLMDSLITSRPISIAVATNKDISQQFDLISYNKGASILRMLSNFLGEDTFRKGLQSYLEVFAYNNTNRNDLWMELNKAAMRDKKDHLDVQHIMDTWTLQMGYPLVTLTRDYTQGDGIHFTAQQQRFLLNSDQPDADRYQYQWHIPLTFTTSSHLGFTNPPQEWLTPGGGTKQFSETRAQNIDWLLGNVESRGYYRVNYDLRNWDLLTEQLMTDHNVIPPASRSSLINDAFNLARAGHIDSKIALNMTKYLIHEKEFVPWSGVDDVIGFLEAMLRGTKAHSDFKSYILRLVTPVYEFIGLNKTGTFLKRRLQAVVVKLACAYGHPDCIRQSSIQFAKWKGNATSNTITPDVRQAVYCTAIAHGDQDDWEFALHQYRTTNSDSEKITLLSGMTCSQDTNILKKYLTSLLNIDVISGGDHARVLSGILANEAGMDLAWTFFWENFNVFLKLHGKANIRFNAMASSLTSLLNSEKQLTKLKSEIAKNPNQGAAQRTFTQGVEITEANIRWMQKSFDTVASWLKQQ